MPGMSRIIVHDIFSPVLLSKVYFRGEGGFFCGGQVRFSEKLSEQ
jgi:hypothetical protein